MKSRLVKAAIAVAAAATLATFVGGHVDAAPGQGQGEGPGEGLGQGRLTAADAMARALENNTHMSDQARTRRTDRIALFRATPSPERNSTDHSPNLGQSPLHRSATAKGTPFAF